MKALFLVRSLDAALYSRDRAALEPHQGFLQFGQCDGVLATGERAGLKRAKPVDHNCQQRFLRYPVYARLFDWPVLEANSLPLRNIFVADVRISGMPREIMPADSILAARAARSRLVNYFDFQLNGLIASHDMVYKLSHLLSSFKNTTTALAEPHIRHRVDAEATRG